MTATMRTGSPYRLALEGPPHHSTVANCKLRQPTSRQYASCGDIEGIHDGYDEVVASAGALDVLQELGGDQLVHVSAEVGGV